MHIGSCAKAFTGYLAAIIVNKGLIKWETTLIEVFPELRGQPFPSYFNAVYTTGISYTGVEEKTDLIINGKLQTFYFNFTYKALRDKEGNIYGIHDTVIDVTRQVLAKKRWKKAKCCSKELLQLFKVSYGPTMQKVKWKGSS